MKMIKIYTIYLLLVFCAVYAFATAKEEEPIKLIRPKLLNPFDDPDKAVELASLAAVVHNEPPAAEGRKTDFKSALANAKMDADDADLDTAKDDLKLLSQNDSCDDTDPNCQKKIDAALKREKKRWKKQHKGSFLELDGSFDPEEEDMMEEKDFDKPNKHKKHSSHKDEDKMEQHSQHKQTKQLRLKSNTNNINQNKNKNKNKHHNHHHRKQHHKHHHHHRRHHQKQKQQKQKQSTNKHSKNKRSTHKIRGEMKHHRQDNENDKDDKFNDDFDDPMFDKDLKDWKSEKTNSMQSSASTKTILQQSPYTNSNPSAPASKPSVPSSPSNFAKQTTPSKFADKLSDLDDDVFLEKEQSVSNANPIEEPMFIEATPVVPISSLKMKSQ